MASVIADMVEWLKRWFYTEDEVDTLLSSKQARLVSGSNIKTINNESILGSGNIEIESGDSGGLVNVEDYYFDEESENLVLESDDEPFITTSWGDPTSDSLTPSEKLVKNSLDAKQDSLISGQNIKTINNESILGSGNIYIQGGSNVDVVTSWSSTLSDTKVPSEKLVKNSLDLKFENIAVTPTSSTDIDTFKDIGFYTFFNDSAVASMTTENKAKLPTGLGDNSFYLLVEKKNNYAKQTLTKYNDGRTWIRIYNNNNNVQSWSDWKELSVVGHTHDDRYYTESEVDTALSNKVSKSSTTGLLKNDGTVDTTSYSTFSGSYSDLSNKPTIPSASSTTPSADTTSGSYGSGTSYARSNHTHPKSSLYAESSHTHTKSQITDFPTIPSKTSDLTNDGSDGTNVFVATNDSRLGDNRNFLVTNVTPTSSTDIDSYKDNGFYTFFNNSAVASMTEENKAKLPTGLGDNSFYLLVEKRNNYAKQTLTKYSDGRTWIRIYNDNNNVQSWSAWQELSVVGHTHDDRYYTETEVDTALNGKQATLVSGTNLKTINNESLLGSGNISISGGGGSVIGTGSFSINSNGHLIVELPNGVDNPYFINNNGHLVYDTSNTYNGE